MKKIVICPVFCDTHYIACQIENIIETIDPDYIIYNEGAFPAGPESKTPEWFLEKYTLDGHRGFDYPELQEVIKKAQKKYSNVQIILNEMNYTSKQSADCYYEGCSNFEQLGIKIERGDLIFPFEGDVFHLESDKDKILHACDKLKPDQGFKTKWLDFIGTHKYLQSDHLSRRVCIKYGIPEFYKYVLTNFQTQYYDMLISENITTFHYVWVRPHRYLNMRYDQLTRGWEYWEPFNQGIKNIWASKSEDKIRIRNAPRGQMWEFAKYYDGPTPNAIMNHEVLLHA